jgi:hypothetical protein
VAAQDRRQRRAQPAAVGRSSAGLAERAARIDIPGRAADSPEATFLATETRETLFAALAACATRTAK